MTGDMPTDMTGEVIGKVRVSGCVSVLVKGVRDL